MILVVKKVLIGHRLGMTLRSGPQHQVPGQRRGSGEGLRAALACLSAGVVDHFQNLLPLCLPVAKTRRYQRARQHDTPVSPFAADPDVDELRVQHHAAETLQHRLECSVGIVRTGQAYRLHSDHRIGSTGQRLLQVQIATGRQHQTRVAGQRRQFHGHLLAAALRLAAIGIEGFDQLRFVTGQRSTGKNARAQHGQRG